MKSKIAIGTKVNGSLGEGIIVNIITRSTGYVEVDYNGRLKKEMAFNLTNENGEILKSKPVQKEAAPQAPKSEMQQLIDMLMKVNRIKASPSLKDVYTDVLDLYAEIQICAGGRGLDHLRTSESFKNDVKPNDFIASIADSVMKYGNCSEKQAYHLAKYVLDNRGGYFFANDFIAKVLNF